MSLDGILAELSRVSMRNVFNPWRDLDPQDVAGAQAPAARLERLRQHFSVRPSFLFIGEAPGYQGCHVTGIPFTSEALVCDGAIPRVPAEGRISTRERPWSEPSARIMWGVLYQQGISEQTVLWNTFPFHPYKSGDLHSNRTPTADEVKSHASILHAVVKHFRGARVIAVGRIAEKTLNGLGVENVLAVRHPSMGGAPLFRSGVEAIARGATG